MISKMEFDCKLAHSDKIRRLSGFASIKDLYEKISKEFQVSSNEILYCTLNTHNFRDMNSLLGNYLSPGDLIVVHLCGLKKELTLRKTHEYLGLTITDNGNGRAFVKKVKSNESSLDLVKPGDHISAINGESTVGKRHYEVAKAIREVPQETNFTLQLIEPLYSGRDHHSTTSHDVSVDFERNRADSSTPSQQELQRAIIQPPKVFHPPTHSTPTNGSSESESIYEDLTNSSLPIDRLLSTGVTAHPEEDPHNSYKLKIEKINSILESFLGINDNTLAIQIYRIAMENKDSSIRFTKAIRTSELNVFSFGEDIENYLWNCAIGSKN